MSFPGKAVHVITIGFILITLTCCQSVVHTYPKKKSNRENEDVRLLSIILPQAYCKTQANRNSHIKSMKYLAEKR